MTTVTQKTNRVTEAQGNFIDQFKNHTNIDAVAKAFAQQSQDLEDAAFDVLLQTTIDTAVGQQLDNIATIVNIEREGRNDADFRVRIGAQISLLKSSGTIEEIIDLVIALGGTTLIFREVFLAGFEIEITTAITNGAEIANVVNSAKPAAVGASVTFFESATPFTFDTVGLGFDQGELGDIVIF